MFKVAMIGAGSTVFAKNLLCDILSYPELQQCTIALHDIDPERLACTDKVARKIAAKVGARPRIEATTDRDAALTGAHYVITMVHVGGYRPCTVTDFEIPKKYGLRQTIGDTLGVAGIMRGLRTAPVLIAIARDMERLCPDALLINYPNPMAINSWAVARASATRSVGLCHSVQWTIGHLANQCGVPVEETNFVCAGVNHLAFFLTLERRKDGVSEDLYPRLRRVLEEGRVPDDDRVRFELFKRFGYFVTESSEHFSEYCPWFIKDRFPELIERFNVPLDEYPRRCENQIAGWEALRRDLEDEALEIPVARSNEYASLIIHSMETGFRNVVHANVLNHGLISNLPDGCCVEVPCLFDKNGIQPVAVGKLPPQLAALMRTNINVQELTVEAILTGKREHVYHAALLDPHTAAELPMDKIVAMVDELLEAHGDWIPALK